jgi:hypothetical protein
MAEVIIGLFVLGFATFIVSTCLCGKSINILDTPQPYQPSQPSQPPPPYTEKAPTPTPS